MTSSTPLVSRTVLDNGLTVVSVVDRAAPIVAVNLWYKVGSRDEVHGRTGFAHLFEHLMFQGSGMVASGEHASLLQEVGGSMNGTTHFDRTNYYETVPRHAVELALWLEADRMASLALTQENLDNQRDVVKNERRQSYDNQPYGTAWEHLVGLVFPESHPYHHMPIGSMADLDAASLEDTTSFFRQHYVPGNAVLTLAGDLSAPEAFALAAQYFGGINPGVVPVRSAVPALEALEVSQRTVLREDVPLAKAYWGWRVPPVPTKENLALQLALKILTQGASSRLVRKLSREAEVVQSVGGFTLGLTGGNDMAVMVVAVRPGTETSLVEDMMAHELQNFVQEGPTEAELQRALAVYHRETLDSLSTLEELADEVSGATSLHDDPLFAFGARERAEALTLADIQDAAQFLLQHHATLEYVPTEEVPA